MDVVGHSDDDGFFHEMDLPNLPKFKKFLPQALQITIQDCIIQKDHMNIDKEGFSVDKALSSIDEEN